MTLYVVIEIYSKKVLTNGVRVAIITPVAAREHTKRSGQATHET